MLRRQNFDDITGLQLMVKWNNPAIYLGADGPIAHLCMNSVSKIQRYGTSRQLDNLTGWSEYEH
ncbi:hypothetical protein D3C76_1707600 [compost metagenome]